MAAFAFSRALAGFAPGQDTVQSLCKYIRKYTKAYRSNKKKALQTFNPRISIVATYRDHSLLEIPATDLLSLATSTPNSDYGV